MRQRTRVTAEQWLTRTFEPALRTSRPPYAELRVELQTLSESGAISVAEALRARRRLDQDERNRGKIARQRSQRARLASDGGDADDRLEAQLTPERLLGDVDGITIVLRVVELWKSRLVLLLEAQQNQITRALTAAFDAEWRVWESRWVEHRAAAEAEDLGPPEQPTVPRLSELPLSVADDLGTRYYAMSMATGGSEHPWRSEWRLEPGVPASASVLSIALEGGEPGTEPLKLALPSRT
jgi:hypothetical protein